LSTGDIDVSTLRQLVSERRMGIVLASMGGKALARIAAWMPGAGRFARSPSESTA
jgi:hypothetical protein